MTIKDIELPEIIEIEQQKLLLIGAGTRKLLFIDIYIGAFYCASKRIKPIQTYTGNISRLVRMHLLQNIGSGSFISKILSEGMGKMGWTPSLSKAKLIENINIALTNVEAKKNDYFDIVWIDSGDFIIYRNEVELFRANNELEFANKIYGIWFNDTQKKHILRDDLLSGLII